MTWMILWLGYQNSFNYYIWLENPACWVETSLEKCLYNFVGWFWREHTFNFKRSWLNTHWSRNQPDCLISSPIITFVFLGYIWLFLTFIENSLEGYIRMMVTNTKLLRICYKNYALLRDSEVKKILTVFAFNIYIFNLMAFYSIPSIRIIFWVCWIMGRSIFNKKKWKKMEPTSYYIIICEFEFTLEK